MGDNITKQEEMLDISYEPRGKNRMDPSVQLRKGTYSYPAPLKHQQYLDLPNQREWQPTDKDWKLPQNWKEIILNGMKLLLSRNRSFKLYLDICVRCGACADKCHYFLGSGDPKNMPVIRAELLRSVYRRYFTLDGKTLRQARGCARPYRRCTQRVVLLFLPVFGMQTVLRILSLWYRHL